MKAMVVSDLLVAKKYLLPQMVIGVLVGLFISVTMQSPYAALPAIGVMIPFSIAFTMLSLDERDHWEQFRLALPLSRTDVMVGRYASLALITLFGLAVGLLSTAVLVIAATVLPTVPQLTNLTTGLSWQPVVMVSAAALAIGVLMLSVILPLVARFGMTKAVRFVPLLIIVGVFFAFSSGGNESAPQLLANLETLSQTPAGVIGMAAAALAGSGIIYALSGILSIKLYRSREF